MKKEKKKSSRKQKLKKLVMKTKDQNIAKIVKKKNIYLMMKSQIRNN
jgi:hypothetical protein